MGTPEGVPIFTTQKITTRNTSGPKPLNETLRIRLLQSHITIIRIREKTVRIRKANKIRTAYIILRFTKNTESPFILLIMQTSGTLATRNANNIIQSADFISNTHLIYIFALDTHFSRKITSHLHTLTATGDRNPTRIRNMHRFPTWTAMRFSHRTNQFERLNGQ